MITTARAIILRSVDFQESSRIVTVLSDRHGKMALIARGAKKPKNKLAGVIETGNILDVVYYYKATREVQTLSEASISYQSRSFRQDFEKASVLFATLELITQLVHEHEESYELFEFTESLIRWLGEEEKVSASVFAYTQLRLAALAGFGLINRIEEEDETVFLNISSGTLSNQPDSELSYKLTRTQAVFLSQALSSRNKGIFSLGLQGGELKQLIHHLDVYFKYHVEGYKERRSDSIFEQLIQEPGI